MTDRTRTVIAHLKALGERLPDPFGPQLAGLNEEAGDAALLYACEVLLEYLEVNRDDLDDGAKKPQNRTRRCRRPARRTFYGFSTRHPNYWDN